MQQKNKLPDRRGYFGAFGGKFIPETLMGALTELEQGYRAAQKDRKFRQELRYYLTEYCGRPTPLTLAANLTKKCGGARIYLKREDLNHTGAHKINNTLGQALLARRMGKPRIIAETGAGQHGVATATACALLGLSGEVYMGTEDMQRQALNVFRMELLGSRVVPVESGSRTLKDAINEALRDWVTNVRTTHYLLGSVVGPHPFPVIVRDFQAVIGHETRRQALAQTGRLPDYLVACVGGGSNSMGLFHPFYRDRSVRFIGVEAAGRGLVTGQHAATLCDGRPGIFHGTKSYLMQDRHGQVLSTHSVSAGLDYPGVGPEHALYKDTARAQYTAVNDDQALDALRLLAETEGIIPALESAHAVAYAVILAKKLVRRQSVVVCLSGRGDKDVETVSRIFKEQQL